MDGAPSINPFTVPFFPFFPIIIIVTTTLILITNAYQDTKENTKIPSLEDDNGAIDMSLQPPVSSADDPNQVVTKSVSFKPSAGAIVGVLATTFSLTFLLLLYIKHCNGVAASNANADGERDLQERKNSGIGRTVVDLLPAFKFGSLRGQKQGLECAVCLTGFEDHEILRLLPKCKHAFHMECVDTWLDKHSTCPLCRYKVDPDDIVHSQELLLSSDVESGRVMSNVISNSNESRHENESIGSRRVSFMRERNSEGCLFSGHSRKVKSESVIGEHRLDHRIVLSPTCSYTSHSGVQQRWSNFETDDMLYLTTDRIISCSSSSRDGRRRRMRRNRGGADDEMENGFGGGGGRRRRRSEWDLRSTVSEMTGVMRFLNRDRRRGRERRGGGGREEQERQREGVASRWWAWISRSQQQSYSRSTSE
ncbi:unnamed protein product [Vicia faba]|uniref:RING-type E3 ubiquitin transferase n=1 Tax=Vicia faba TaxID=3906 RepID=A0AAV0YIF8_VICFA|nr:unnamed protein product [Vicia faba]